MVTQTDDRFKVTGWRFLLKGIAAGLIVDELLKDEEIVHFRRVTCLACPEMNHEHKTCNVCGCFLDLKTRSKTNRTKRGIEVTHCPLGKWDDKDIAEHYAEQKSNSKSF